MALFLTDLEKNSWFNDLPVSYQGFCALGHVLSQQPTCSYSHQRWPRESMTLTVKAKIQGESSTFSRTIKRLQGPSGFWALLDTPETYRGFQDLWHSPLTSVPEPSLCKKDKQKRQTGMLGPVQAQEWLEPGNPFEGGLEAHLESLTLLCYLCCNGATSKAQPHTETDWGCLSCSLLSPTRKGCNQPDCPGPPFPSRSSQCACKRVSAKMDR